MSSKIHILGPEVANKIAAGEVVQRPASAVKELIENALDAGARKITILVKEAGKAMLQVVDDGEGMTEDDALLAFQRHATSKIRLAEDLEQVHTLGFRGEALASIAAVSHVELRTRTRSEELATLIRVEGSEVRERTKLNAEPGTSVIVRNLFANTPARRAFLKSDRTELKNMTDVVTRMAVIYPEVAWLYVSDDEALLDVRPASPEDRFIDVFGERHFRSALRVHDASDYMSMDGFVGKPDFVRKSRTDQFLYLNRRSIVSRTVSHAVFHAFEHLMVKNVYPFFVLNLLIDPRKVDVNVHPSKQEVKFENDSAIYRTVLAAVRKTLAANDLIPSVSIAVDNRAPTSEQKLRFGAFPLRTPLSEAFDRGESGRMPGTTNVEKELGAGSFDVATLFHRGERTTTRPSHAEVAPHLGSSTFGDQVASAEAPPPSAEHERASRHVWQVHNKYILSPIPGGLLIVDQHAAHERILYERAVMNFEQQSPPTQELLFPQTLHLGAQEYALIGELLPHLEKLGFGLKLFGKNTVVIEGLPVDVRVGKETTIVHDVLDEYQRNEHATRMDARDAVAKSFACRAAIKAGDKLNAMEMSSLIDTLLTTQMPYVCPHGRPVLMNIALEELDRRFGRTS